MSLSSLINGNSSSTDTRLYSNPKVAAAAALLAAHQAGTTSDAARTAASSNGTATISATAKIAAAEDADNAKNFSALSTDVRATLDDQYAADKAAKTHATADLSEMSGRALAAIVLNQNAQFSPTEIAAAKSTLNERTRKDMADAIDSSGTSMSSLSTYSQMLVTQYDNVSSEERQARGWTASTRRTATNFVQAASGTQNSSLFDAFSDG